MGVDVGKSVGVGMAVGVRVGTDVGAGRQEASSQKQEARGKRRAILVSLSPCPLIPLSPCLLAGLPTPYGNPTTLIPRGCSTVKSKRTTRFSPGASVSAQSSRFNSVCSAGLGSADSNFTLTSS